MRIYLALFLTFTLVCCASMTKEECLSANWNEIGNRDGGNGRSISSFDGYVKDCAKVNVVPDRSTYIRGRDVGLSRYCTLNKGYGFGLTGNDYFGICANHNETAFLRGRKLGLEIFALEKAHEDALAKVKSLDKEIADAENEIKTLNAEINDKNLSSRQVDQKINLIAINKRSLSALKNTRYDLIEKSDRQLRRFNAKKESHVELGYCEHDSCFTRK